MWVRYTEHCTPPLSERLDTLTHRTCTAQLAVTGLCGKPAVFTFTSRNGEVFSECEAHHNAAAWVNHTPTPAVTTKSVTLTHPRTGNKVRTTSGHRFLVVVDHGSKAVLIRRSNDLATARKVARANSTAVVFDRFTREVVA